MVFPAGAGGGGVADSALSMAPLGFGLGGAALGGALSLIGANQGAKATEAELARQEGIRSGIQDQRIASGQAVSGGLANQGTEQLQNTLNFLMQRLDPSRNQQVNPQQVQGQFDQNLMQSIGNVQFDQPTSQAGMNTMQAAGAQQQQQLAPLLQLLQQQAGQRGRAGFDAQNAFTQQMANAPLQQNIGDLGGNFNLQQALLGLQEQQQLGNSQMQLEKAGQTGGGLRLLGSLVPQIGLGLGGALA